MKEILVICTLFFLLHGNWAAEMRVVSLAPALSEIVCYLGGEKTLVGRCSACDYPESIKSLPAAGRFGMPEIERIAALRPDWVIGNDLMNKQLIKKLNRLGIETAFEQINNINDYLFWLKLIGEKLSKIEPMQAALETFTQKKADLQRLPPLPLKVVWIVNAKPLIVAGTGSLPDGTMQLMHVENAAADVDSAYFKCSPEWLLSRRIDLIIWGIPGSPAKSDRFWQKVPAVQKNQIVFHDIYDPVTRPGPRYLDAVLVMRKKIEQKAGFAHEK